MKLKGKLSTFGGRNDTGMTKTEGLSLYWKHSQCDAKPHLFLPRSDDPNEGTAHRLNTNALYIAVRFPVEQKEELRDSKWKLTNPVNGKSCVCDLVDWGPNVKTERCVDVSPAVGRILEVKTDDEVEVELLEENAEV